MTVISTGIGTDNVDIVVNEIDAIHNIDFVTRKVKKNITPLHFIRIGTSGGLQKNIPVDSFIASDYGIGLDSLMQYYPYENKELEMTRLKVSSLLNNNNVYVAASNSSFLEKSDQFIKGTTLSANGFYGPQGRQLRLPPKNPKMINDLSKLTIGSSKITNLEMETAGLYALSSLLGHESISYSVILANRQKGTFSSNPKEAVNKLIVAALDVLTR
jgi:uridine phosphorylase